MLESSTLDLKCQQPGGVRHETLRSSSYGILEHYGHRRRPIVRRSAHRWRAQWCSILAIAAVV